MYSNVFDPGFIFSVPDDFYITYGQSIFETSDCLPDEVIDRNGQCQQCEELNLGCSVCSDAFENTYDEFAPDQLNKCVECEANIQVLFEDKKTEVTYVHKYPPNWAYEWY